MANGTYKLGNVAILQIFGIFKEYLINLNQIIWPFCSIWKKKTIFVVTNREKIYFCNLLN